MKSNQQQWIALFLPRLPLEAAFTPGCSTEPWGVAESRSLVDCNSAAFAQGVRPWMSRAAATALSPNLRLLERDLVVERAAIEALACWAGCYSPNVALTEPQGTEGLLLEVSGSLKLFGSAARIAADLVSGVGQMGYTAQVASAPTALGAWWLARGGSSSPCLSTTDLQKRLQPLPVEVLGSDARTRATLESIGVGTLGELLSLPRAGLARRFGKALADDIDRGLGDLADPRIYLSPPEKFNAALELPAEVHEATVLVFALRRLVVQLGGYLSARDGGVQKIHISLFHKQSSTEIEIGLVKPNRDPEHLLMLIREKLSSLTLKQPVRRIELSADDILQISHENLDLLDDTLKKPGVWHGLIEHLQARLGNHAVTGIAMNSGHRPEAAWRVAMPGEQGTILEFGARPLWLLKDPRRLEEVDSAPHCDGPLALLSGPERIESGWWDGHDAVRDYFVARGRAESLLWIYRERGLMPGHWYLHGIFA